MHFRFELPIEKRSKINSSQCANNFESDGYNFTLISNVFNWFQPKVVKFYRFDVSLVNKNIVTCAQTFSLIETTSL